MITEGLLELCIRLFGGMISALEAVNLPLELLSPLGTMLGYGTWIVGADLMLLIVGSIVFWWSVHLSIGVAIWAWNLLPFT